MTNFMRDACVSATYSYCLMLPCNHRSSPPPRTSLLNSCVLPPSPPLPSTRRQERRAKEGMSVFARSHAARVLSNASLPAAAAAAAIDKLKKQIDQWLRRSLQNCQLNISEFVFRSDRSISPRLYFEKQV
jgi:hypothetical protein